MKGFYAIIAVLLLAGAPGPVRAELADAIRAVVHDSVISNQQLELATAPVAEDYRRQYGSQPEVFQKKLLAALDENLDYLVQNAMIMHDFESSGQYHLPESIIDEELQNYIKSQYGEDRVRFIKTLQAEGKTYEQFRREFKERLITQQMRIAHGASAVIVSPHKIEVYYVEHQSQYSIESQVKLRMIVLNKSADDPGMATNLAAEIVSKLDGGASFAEMASVYSQGSQRTQGGDWGWVEKSVLRKELADVAFSLKPGQHSGVIDTSEACYIMLVEEKKPEHVRPLNEVRDAIEQVLLAQEKNRLQKQWIERLRRKTFIRYF
ncbi:MAG: peptidylprolyl isomerase [Verrucomicrobiota bacterium]